MWLQWDAVVSQADLKQTYLPAFESVVKGAKIRGIMCAYNSVNGVPLCANEMLAKELRGNMGFDGIVITGAHTWTATRQCGRDHLGLWFEVS